MKNKRLWFASEFSTDDPRVQTEDLGDNAMLSGEYGIRNLQWIMPRLLEWTYERNENYRNLSGIYTGVIGQYDYYLEHVMANFGGIYETNKTGEQSGPVYEPISAERQKEAMDFIKRHVFITPTWLLDSAVLSRTSQSPAQIIGRSQDAVLYNMLGNNTLGKISTAESAYGNRTYSLLAYLNNLDEALWMELITLKPIDIYRRNLQRSYLDKLIELSNAPSSRDTRDVGPIIKQKLEDIHLRLAKTIPKIKDEMTLFHLKYMDSKIRETMNIK